MRSKISHWLAVVTLALAPALASAQDAATASIHGHNQDPANGPLASSQVVLSTDGKTPLYTFTADANGDYKGANIKPGTYAVTLFSEPGKSVDRFDNVKLTAGTDTLQDFDLSRKEFLDKMPPEQRKALEEAKAKNAEIMKQNANVGKLNDMLKQARADNAAKKYDDAAAVMTQATTMRPDAPQLWLELGVAQNGQKKYDDAQASLKKALDLDMASKKPSPEVQASAQSHLGDTYALTDKLSDATSAYDAAAKLQPAGSALIYSNAAVVFFNSNHFDEAIGAADKSIAADPKKPVPYYVKGKSLLNKGQDTATLDQASDAFKKCLDIAPSSPFAPEAKELIADIEQSKKKPAFKKN